LSRKERKNTSQRAQQGGLAMCLDLRRYQQMTANLFVHSDSDVEGLIRRASIPCKAYLQILRDTHADQT
jgi:hypothetical protein